jgi:hypothetical protein
MAFFGTVAFTSLGTLNMGCGSGRPISGYPIDSTVARTTQRVLSFPMPSKVTNPGSGTGLCPLELSLVSQYAKYGYGEYTFGGGLPVEQRFDLMPPGYASSAPTRIERLASFFAMSDVHITDKEAPNQLIHLQQADPVMGAPNTSIYSPVMLYSTHVLDAAIQTVNVLHKETPFDFGICLGDVCNSAQYNELRWYIDVIDGKVIHPSSGAHLGAARAWVSRRDALGVAPGRAGRRSNFQPAHDHRLARPDRCCGCRLGAGVVGVGKGPERDGAECRPFDRIGQDASGHSQPPPVDRRASPLQRHQGVPAA